ncbi:MAG TPA: hypothetical protein VGK19_01075 [Capsulimonadaceae bacterium]|jgi:hypothetical protein
MKLTPLILSAVVLLTCALPLRAVSLTESFAAPSGPLGVPSGWDATDIGYSVGNGKLTCEPAGQRVFALWKSAPIGRSVTVTADVTAGSSTGVAWNVAGIGIMADEGNYWHLALRESPQSMGRIHGAELCEMRQGNWLAQYSGVTKLTQLPGVEGFSWKAGLIYHFTLTLTPDQIVGEISEGGVVRYRAGYKFDAPAVTYGRPMLDSNGVAVTYGTVTATIDTPVPDASPTSTYPPFEWRAETMPGGRATGFFHVEQIAGVWWLVDPKGRLCFDKGVDHVTYRGMSSEKLGYAPYARIVAAKYPSEEAWGDAQAKRLESWGFNVVGAGTTSTATHKGLAHSTMLSLGSIFPATADIVPKGTWTGFPDVYDPRFVQFCELRAKRLCAPAKADPWLLGYYIDNELEWFGKMPRPAQGLAFSAWRHDGTHACKQALVAAVRKAYGPDIVSVNAEFGTTYAAYDAFLASETPGAPKTDRARKVLDGYIADTANRFFDITTSAIRRNDPNHMILGVRFAGDAPESAYRAAGRTCDIVAINIYPRLDITHQTSPELVAKLERTYSLCARPVAITEWSFPALDAVDSKGIPLPSVHGAGMRVDTQAQRATCFQAMQRILASTPYVVGSHYFMYEDEPSSGISSTFPEDSNYGLVSEADEPYKAITDAATRVNATVLALHSGRCAKLSVASDDKTITVTNSGQIAVKVPLAIWLNGAKSTRTVDLPAGGKYALDPALFVPYAAEACYVHVECDPDHTLPQTTTANLTADLVLKPRVVSRISHPVAVWNPSAVPLHNVVSGEDTLEAISVGDLGPYGCKTVWEKDFRIRNGPVQFGAKYSRTPTGYVIDNGVLRLTKSQPTGAIFDSVELVGSAAAAPAGTFWPLVHVYSGQGDTWTKPEKIVDVKQIGFDRDSVVLDVTARLEPATAPGYECAYRISITAGQPFFRSRILWIRNINTEPLDCRDYFHYALSAAETESKSVLPPNYWTSLGIWRDDKSRVEYGVTSPDEASVLNVTFWKDKDGTEHPDCYRRINVVIKPGERWTAPADEPFAIVGAVVEHGPGTGLREQIPLIRAQCGVLSKGW